MKIIFYLTVLSAMCGLFSSCGIGGGTLKSPTGKSLVTVEVTADLSSPTLSSDITLSSPSFLNTNSGPIEYIITFASEADADLLGISSISFLTNDFITATTSLSKNGVQRKITLSEIVGEGSFRLTITISDKFFISTIADVVKVDKTAPTILSSNWSMTTPENGSTSNEVVPVVVAENLESVDEGASVDLFDEMNCASENIIGSGTISASSVTISNISLTSGPIQVQELPSGIVHFYTKVKDLAGNESGCSDLELAYYLDRGSDPADPSGLVLLSSANGTTSNNNTPQIATSGLAGFGEADVGVMTIYDSQDCATEEGSGIGWATIMGGSFTVSNILYMNDGSHDGVKNFYGQISQVSQGAIHRSQCVNLNLSFKLDTIAPTAPTGWTLVSPSNGVSSNNNTPEISGNGLSAENGGSVLIYDTVGCSGVLKGSAVIANGDFTVSTISYTTSIDDGAKSFYGEIVDIGGNNSLCTILSLGYLYDTGTPLAPTGLTLSSPTSSTTSSDITPEISGNSEAGALMAIYDMSDCSHLVGSATLSAGIGANAEFTVSNINYVADGSDDGVKYFYALVTDSAGNSSSCLDLNVNYKIDSITPSDPTGWTQSSPAGGTTTNDNTPQFLGSGLVAESTSTINVYDSAGCGSSVVGSATIVSSGDFTVSNISYATNGSSDGAKSFYATITDVAGHTTACTNLSLGYVLDMTPPANPSGWVFVTSPVNSSTSNVITPQIAGTGGSFGDENGGHIKIYDNISCAIPIGEATISGGAFTVSNISYTATIHDGIKTFYGEIIDSVGNSSSCLSLELTYLLDTIAPSAPSGWALSSPSNGATTSDMTPQISGVAENLTFITLFSSAGCGAGAVGSATVSGGNFTVSNITFPSNGTQDGIKSFYGIVTDNASNASACTSLNLGYLFDTVTPSSPSGWTMTSPTLGATSADITPQIRGGGLESENASIITLYDAVGCADPKGTATITSGSFTVSNIAYNSNGSDDGTKNFYGKITDAVGHNSSCVNLSLDYKLDTTVPSNPTGWAMSSPSSGVTSNDNTPRISGGSLSGENSSFVFIYDDGGTCTTPLATATINGGTFTVSGISYLTNGTQDGLKTFYGKIGDVAGNSSTCINLSLGYALDTVAPINPSGWTLTVPTNGTTSGLFAPQISVSGLGAENGSYAGIYLTNFCDIEKGSATISGGSFAVTNITFATDSSDNGTKDFYATITDVGGNVSACTNLNLGYLFDSTLVSVGITAPTALNFINALNMASITVSGNCSTNDRAVTVGATGGLSASPNCSSNAWTTTFNFTAVGNGNVTITADHTNESNHSATQATVTLVKDAVLPSDPSGFAMSSPSSGATSSDYTPQIHAGSLGAENGGTIYLYDNVGCGTPKGTATISAGSFTVSNITYTNDGVQDGTKVFYGKIIDVAGNSSNCVDLTLGYKLDTTPPANPSGLAIASPANGATTNDNTPTVNGSGLASENTSFVTLYDVAGCGGGVIGSATIDSGTFTVSDISYLTNGTEDGSKLFYGKITDVATNSSACTPLSLGYKLDTTAPSNPSSWTLSSPNNGITSSDNTPALMASGLEAEDGAQINIYATAGCNPSIGSSTISSGSFTVSNIAFATNGDDDGTRSFFGKMTDVAGNSSSCVDLSVSYLFDVIAPSNPTSWNITSPVNNTTSNDVTPQINKSGLVAENASVINIYDSAGCNPSIGSATIVAGDFTVSNISYLNNGTQDGTKSYWGKITDGSGNPSACVDLSLGYKLDTNSPSNPSGWAIASPSQGVTSSDNTPEINASGLATENSSLIYIYDSGACGTPVGTSTIASGTFTVSTISYAVNHSADGTLAFYGKIIDVAGNSSNCVSLSLGYLFDTTSPSNPSGWTLTSPSSGVTSSDNTPSVRGSGLVAEATSIIDIYDDAGSCVTPIGGATVTGGGDFTISNITYATNGSSDATFAFWGKITDIAGNVSSCVSLNLGYMLDTITPSDPSSWTLSSPSTGVTSNDYTPAISKAGLVSEDGTTAYVYDNISCVAPISSVVIVAGSFNITNITYANNGTADGTKTFYGKLVDVAGHSSTCVDLTLGYLLDTTAPSVPSAWSMTSPSNGSTSADNTPEINKSGLASEDGAQINIYGSAGCGAGSLGSATIASGSFTVGNISYLTNGTEDGTKSHYGRITDVAGNTNACTALSLGYLLDTTVPSAPSGWTMSSPNTGSTSNDYTPQIAKTGIASENSSLVTIYDVAGCGAGVIGSATVVAGSFTVSNITYANNGTQDGTKTFYGIFSDVAGNASACTDLSLGYLLDTTPPTLTISTPTMDSTIRATDQASYTVSGNCSEEGRTVTITTTVGLGATPTCTTGSYTTSLNFSSYLDGPITITASLSDVVGATTQTSVNVYKDSLTYNIQSISTGTDFSCALLGDSTIKCWGTNTTYGFLGQEHTVNLGDNAGEMGDNLYAINLGTNKKVMFMSSGYEHSCALLNDSGLKCWGRGTSGRLGQGNSSNYGTGINQMGDNLSSIYLGTNKQALMVSFGDSHSCVLLNDLSVKCFGSGMYGVLGQGNATALGDSPNEMGDNLSAINLGTNKRAVMIKSGYYANCVLLNDSSMKCWGRNNYGQLGQGHTIELGDNADEMGDNLSSINLGTNKSVVMINVNYYHVCALLNDLSVKCWGYNSAGQLGQGHANTLGDNANELGDNLSPILLGSNKQATMLSSTSGYYSTCAVLNDSSLKCWGGASSGALGQGNSTNYGSSANQMGDNLSSLLLGTNKKVMTLSQGRSHTCVLLNDSSVKCWGPGSSGQLGQGANVALGDGANEMGNNLSAINLGTSSHIIKRPLISASIGISKDHLGTLAILGEGSVCAINDDSNIRCWGLGSSGQLGQGNTLNLGDDVNELGDNLSSILLGSGKNILIISGGDRHACALLDDFTVKCWGSGALGKLGQGNGATLGDGASEMGDNLSPILFGANRKALFVSAGYSHSCAILDNTNVKCWGENSHGELGQGNLTATLGMSANQMGDNLSTINLGTNKQVVMIASGHFYSCALLNDYSVKCFGINGYGQLGQGNTNSLGDETDEMGDNLSTLNLGTNRTPVMVSVSDQHSCALLDGGNIKCWGNGNDGQLGQGNSLTLGDNTDEMGDNLSTIILGTNKTALMIAQGTSHTCAFISDSTVKCWGLGSSGQLGQGNSATLGDNADEMGDNLSTIALSMNKKVLLIASSGNSNCALLGDSSVKCWGENSYGQLGQGSTSSLGDNADEMGNNLFAINLIGHIPDDPNVTGWSLSSPNSGVTSSDYTPQIVGANLVNDINNTLNIYGSSSCTAIIGTATVAANGSFTVSNIVYASNGTQDGTKNFYIKITDGVSLQSSSCVSLSLGYLLDTIVPTNPSGWSMTSPNNNTTSNDVTPQINKSGLASENGATISIYDVAGCGGAVIGTATIVSGTFTVSNIAYLNNGTQDGTEAFYGTITDGAGNSSSCTNLSLGYLLDTTVPVVTITAPLADSALAETTLIQGSCSEEGRTVTAGITGWSSATSVCSGGSYSVSVDVSGMPDGAKTITADMSDAVGNNAVQATVNVLMQIFVGYKVQSIVTGANHTCALLSDGSLKCWGENSSGALGQGAATNLGDAPGQMGDNLSVISLGTGKFPLSFSLGRDNDSCVQFSDLSAKCFGRNDVGQLGQGHMTDLGNDPDEMGDNLSPLLLGTSKQAIAVSSGLYYSCALLTDSTVKCFGYNNYGQLGQGNTTTLGNISNEMGDNLSVISLGTSKYAISIATGDTHACAILQDSTVKCWGRNNYGQLGLGTTENKGDSADEMGDNLSTVFFGTDKLALMIESSNGFNCALLSDSNLKCWGLAGAQLGQGVSENNIGDNADEMGNNLSSIILGTGALATFVSLGSTHSCALLTDSNVKCWGINSNGELGQGTTASISDTANQMGDNLSPILLGTGSAKKTLMISSKGFHTCALLVDSSVKCWGPNDNGQLGQGHTVNLGDNPNEMGDNLSVIQLGGSVGRVVKKMSVLPISSGTSCVLLSDSTLKCWGDNSYGGLGKGNTNNLGDNANEMGSNLSAINLGTGKRAKNIIINGQSTCALLTDASLKCWGSNVSGQSGRGSAGSAGDNANEMGDNLSTVNLGVNKKVLLAVPNCALLDDATVKCWGWNPYGQIGLGHVNTLGDNIAEMGDNLSSINFGSGKLVLDVSAGSLSHCVLLNDATVKCWGYNGYGSMGQGTQGVNVNIGDNADEMGDNLTTINLGTGKWALSIAPGGGLSNHYCIILNDSNLKCWGDGIYGALGNGAGTYKGLSAGQMGDNLVTANLGTGKRALAASTGGRFTCVLLSDSTIKCFGHNNLGQLGLGHTSEIGDSASETGDNLSTINLGTSKRAIGVGAGYEHACALLHDSTMKCWGNANAGRIGQGNISNIGDNADEMGDNLLIIAY